tara:strand:- start:2610 stop:4013 length:1404 start_codon:yes stop_codon:yes gene_type:complete
MSNNTVRDSLQLFNILNETLNSFKKNRMMEEELENFEKKQDYLAEKKAEATEKNRMTAINANTATKQYDNSKKNIMSSLNQLNMWGITDDVVQRKVKSHLKTSGYERFKNLNLDDLNDDLAFEFKTANDSRNTYANMIKAGNHNKKVQSVLDGMLAQINQEIPRHLDKVKKEGGVTKLAKDLGDVDDYIEAHPNTFQETVPVYDEFGNDTGETQQVDNFLGTAFRRPEQWINGKKYGFINQAQILEEENDRIKEEQKILEKEETDWENVSKMKFQTLTSLENKIEDFHRASQSGKKGDKRIPSSWIIANTGGLLDYIGQGKSTMYSNPESGHALKEKLADKVLSILNYQADDAMMERFSSRVMHDMDDMVGTIRDRIKTASGKKAGIKYDVMNELFNEIVKGKEGDTGQYGASGKFRSEQFGNLNLDMDDVASGKHEEMNSLMEQYLFSLVELWKHMDLQYSGVYQQ